MQIIDCTKDGGLDRAVRVQPPGQEAPVGIAVEHTLRVFVNEQPAMRLVCTPEHLDELVIGRLITEGLVESPGDISDLYICSQGLTCKVWLKNGAALRPSAEQAAMVSTCCTDNRTYLERTSAELPRVRPIPWQLAWFGPCLSRLREGDPLYGLTRAVHACYLGTGGEIVCAREDIGRHNAMDKAIGWGWMAGVDLSACYLFTTGRMPADMVVKAIRAGVPILVSKTYPTDQGIRLAREAGLTLITVRAGDEALVWSDGQAESAGG